MKKLLTLIFVTILLLSSTFMTACIKETSKPDVVVGSYNFYSLTEVWGNGDNTESKTVKVGEEFNGTILTEYYIVMELKSDGSVLASNWVDAKWTRNGENIIITRMIEDYSNWDEETGQYAKVKKSVECTYIDDLLTITDEQGILVMKKAKSIDENSEKIVGVYKFFKQTESGWFGEQEIDMTYSIGDMLGDYVITENYYVLELRKGGIFILSNDRNGFSGVGGWKNEGNSLTLIGSISIFPGIVTIENKTITITEENGGTIILKKN